jgi:putative transposase
MRKYHIICPIRQRNPYKQMRKATIEHATFKNILNRNFKQNIPGKVLLTDITYLKYGKGQTAYLSTIKDACTNEILGYNTSKIIDLELVIETFKRINKKLHLAKDAFVHSDQGWHYTNPTFQKFIKSMKLGQSMSRKGNCWDNAPQESFFGHMKDEINIKKCSTYTEIEVIINDYMDYYNNHRYQWNLKQMTPVQYRNHLLAA